MTVVAAVLHLFPLVWSAEAYHAVAGTPLTTNLPVFFFLARAFHQSDDYVGRKESFPGKTLSFAQPLLVLFTTVMSVFH